MTQRYSVGLSFRGAGQVILVTPRTVRTVLQQIKQASPRLSGAVLHQLSHDWLTDDDQLISAIDRLTSNSNGLLTRAEVKRFEAQFNAMLVRGAWRLPPQVPHLESFQHRSSRTSKCRRGFVISFNGALFDVELTPREIVQSSGPRDGFLVDHDHNWLFVRYFGIEPSADGTGLVARLANRYRTEQSRRMSLAEFRRCRFYTIKAAYPAEGFHIAECSPFLKGT